MIFIFFLICFKLIIEIMVHYEDIMEEEMIRKVYSWV